MFPESGVSHSYTGIVPDRAQPSGVRRAELVATLSLGTDLGFGQPMEHALRQCLIAIGLGERLGLADPERETTYYSGLLAWVGCHVDAYEQAKWFGDDIALKADVLHVDRPGPAFALSHVGAGQPPLRRARLGLAFLGEGRRAAEDLWSNHGTATARLATQLGLGEEVRAGLRQVFERWDGLGPDGRRGEEIPLASRLVSLADVVEVFHRSGGTEAAVAVAEQRSGSQFDPELVRAFRAEAKGVFEGLDEATSWDAVIAAQPALDAKLSEAELDTALEAIADFADLKSPWTIGHSRGVAELAEEAARAYGMPEADVATLRRAALVHDLGRLGVSNSIWDKRGPLTRAEMERVRLHPYLSERMLSFSPALAPLGDIAVQHHERLDGSGYPRGLAGETITPAGRILAAADAYHAMTEVRPHRPALSPEEAEATLRREVAAGRLDGEAADAVLRAAGHRVRRRREWPAGLTPREVEVLRLLAYGLSNREIAERLVIAPKTAGNHIEHIYLKIGASNRAMASLFAAEHGLMRD
jgi:HD-GYP domain-containing protein (c-di-GMP phosphodiesterase class II)